MAEPDTTPDDQAGDAAGAAPPAKPRLDNEALKQLFFNDPHFRQSDGLDVAVDEVFEIASSPLARQRKILQARALGMLDDEMLEQEAPPPDAAGGDDHR